MKRIFRAYRELLGILFAESPFLVISVFVSAIITGAIVPVSIWVNSRIFNLGLSVASGEMPFARYIPYLVLFVVLIILPVIIGDLFIFSYAEPRSQLILRTAYKGKMLQKLKRLRYEHLESEASMEIVDKAYNRAENAARHMFPMYVNTTLSAIVATAGTLYLFFSVKWWFLLTILVPFALQTWLAQKFYFNIYDELEKYWNKERQYGILGNILRSRDFIKENRLFQSSDYMIDTYRKRLANRNREYEKFYFKHLRRNFTKQNITKITQIGNALLLLWLYTQGGISIGLLITLTIAIFTSLYSWSGLDGCTIFFRASGFHIKTFDFVGKYFGLSEDEYGSDDEIPADLTIEFDNVHFKYPGTEKEILKGLTFKVNHGEKVSIVGENGEGKTTMIKLLLGLFQPDSGEIRIGSKPLSSYSQETRSRLFGPVFQDFVKYSITLSENVGVGDVDKVNDNQAVAFAMRKAKTDAFAKNLPDGVNTLLGRDFEGGVDLSGGQWQRIAIARAFMGDKPILILDEPTSQLDPMAESRIYSEFAEMSEGKTAVFITHRLGSTMITDRIYVIADGRISQSGSHGELMEQGGLYMDMFSAQKQWYVKDGEEDVSDDQ
ncbi:MAG: ABC transporter ATP-binding protein/permease [Oscillospiraceae bacterium]|nr:ABC transporter ATP-binding protein/permease [Oscillospiraceae bacterium]